MQVKHQLDFNGKGREIHIFTRFVAKLERKSQIRLFRGVPSDYFNIIRGVAVGGWASLGTQNLYFVIDGRSLTTLTNTCKNFDNSMLQL